MKKKNYFLMMTFVLCMAFSFLSCGNSKTGNSETISVREATAADNAAFVGGGLRFSVVSYSDMTVTVCGTSIDIDKETYTGGFILPAYIDCNGKKYTVISLSANVFDGFTKITSISLPTTLQSIGVAAFRNCSSLTMMEIPNSVTSIGEYAFSWCTDLTSVEIPNSVTSIGCGAFGGCTSLKAFAGKFASADNRCLIIDGLLVAFSPMGLTTYEIPNSVTSIGDLAFSNCTDLTSVLIPNSVTAIRGGAFQGCSNMTSLNIPNSVTSIGDLAFTKCSSLTSVKIPNSITQIGKFVFAWCSDLTSVEIGSSVTKIEENAFYNCSSLTSINIPQSVTSIRQNAFSGCSMLTSVVIPNSVTSIGQFAFFGCSRLKEITSLAVTPPIIDDDTAFSGVSKTETVVKVPKNSLPTYKRGPIWNHWKEFKNITGI